MEHEASMPSHRLTQAALHPVADTMSARNAMTGAEKKKSAHSVAIVLHFLSHYREAIYRRLTDIEESEWKYVLYSDTKSNISSLKVIDFDTRAADTPTPGRITWRRIANVWLGQHVCWQKGVLRLAWGKEHDTLIFMGSMYFLSTWAACLLARSRGKRVLMWGHGFRYRERGAKGLLRGIFYRLAHGHLLYGHHAREIMLAKGFPSDALYVIYNTLDIGHLSGMLDDFLKTQGRRPNGSNAEALQIVVIGRLTVEKQITLLVDALAMLRDDGFDAELTVIGDGPDREAISVRAETLGVSKQIRWLGALYDEALICPHVAAADLCVVPGKLGLTAVHAMAYGTPVITHDDFKGHSPEFEVIVPGRTGMFFRKGDASDLANAIRAWRAQGHDRATLRQRCRHIVGTYYTPQMQQSIIDKAVAGVPATLVPEASTRPQLDV
jgi:glycosyltransferase involved in cell wall biosynthesis